jgi:hypothetical protein
MLSGISAAFLCLALFILAVVVRFHRPPVGHRLRVMMRIWAVLLPVYAALYFGVRAVLPAWLGCPLPWRNLEGLVAFLNGALLYALLFLAWCYCYFCTDHSLSVLYMMALEDTDTHRLSLDDIKKAFPYEEMLRQRLLDLQNNGFVVVTDQTFSLTEKGRRNARIAGGLKRFLHLEPGG